MKPFSPFATTALLTILTAALAPDATGPELVHKEAERATGALAAVEPFEIRFRPEAAPGFGHAAPDADPCPAPVILRVHGPTDGETGVEAALDETVSLNGDSVRFVEDLAGPGGPMGHEYALAGERTDGSVDLTLTDPAGRLVASSSAPIGGQGEAEAGRVAAQGISPLLARIRDHQRRLRQEEETAIAATISMSPTEATIGTGERLRLDVLLLDCDDTPLSSMPIEFEHSGVGGLVSDTTSTDERGRANVTFVSDRTGSATVTAAWHYENTEGVSVDAMPETRVAIRVETTQAEIPVREGRWDLTASISAEGAMTTVGEWLGTFQLVEGDRIQGDGTITTTVSGSCVSGVKAVPMRITGHRSGETLYLTVIGEDDDSEPDTTIDESLGCVVRTLTELPSFFSGLARFGEMIVMNEPCPLRVPTTNQPVSAECAGITFHVTPAAGG